MKPFGQILAKRMGILLALEVFWLISIAYFVVGFYGIEHLGYAVTVWVKGRRWDTMLEFLPTFVLFTGMILCTAFLWAGLEYRMLKNLRENSS